MIKLSSLQLSESLNQWAILNGKQFLFFESVTSTNEVAYQIASEGKIKDLIVVADSQTAGRGRLKRQWVSPPRKNLYISFVISPQIPLKIETLLPLMAGVSVANAIRRFVNIDISLKWPNDILVKDKKLGGILTEIKSQKGEFLYLIVGIGVNVNFDKSDMPKEIREIATSLKIETGFEQLRGELAIRIIESFYEWYEVFINDRKKKIIDEWIRLSSIIGKRIEVWHNNSKVEGVAEGLNEDGSLLIRSKDNSLKNINTGNITDLP